MKNPLIILILTVAASVFSAFIKIEKELDLGQNMPKQEVKMKNVDGTMLSLKEASGENGLLVIFSSNTCPWVIAWEDRYNDLHEIAQKNGVGMIVINSNEAQRDDEDSFEAMKEHSRQLNYSFSYVLDKDHEVADAFGATRTPHVFLFDKDLNLVYRGAIDDNSRNKNEVTKPYLINAIGNMVSNKTIDPATTRSLGCTIKRKGA